MYTFRFRVIIRLILCIRKGTIAYMQGHVIKDLLNPKENLSELFQVSTGKHSGGWVGEHKKSLKATVDVYSCC